MSCSALRLCRKYRESPTLFAGPYSFVQVPLSFIPSLLRPSSTPSPPLLRPLHLLPLGTHSNIFLYHLSSLLCSTNTHSSPDLIISHSVSQSQVATSSLLDHFQHLYFLHTFTDDPNSSIRPTKLNSTIQKTVNYYCL
jgi:hypothetical protein